MRIKNSFSFIQAGFSLLEVLVALVILVFGLLGFAQAELMALRHNQVAYLQSIAMLQVSAMADRLRSCSMEGNLVTACINPEINTWKRENIALLPQAESEAIAMGNAYKLTIQWQTLPMGLNKNLSSSSITMIVRL